MIVANKYKRAYFIAFFGLIAALFETVFTYYLYATSGDYNPRKFMYVGMGLFLTFFIWAILEVVIFIFRKRNRKETTALNFIIPLIFICSLFAWYFSLENVGFAYSDNPYVGVYNKVDGFMLLYSSFSGTLTYNVLGGPPRIEPVECGILLNVNFIVAVLVYSIVNSLNRKQIKKEKEAVWYGYRQ